MMDADNPNIWSAGDGKRFLVATASRKGVPCGRLVNVAEGFVSGEMPLDSLARNVDVEDDWKVFAGDPAKVLAVLDEPKMTDPGTDEDKEESQSAGKK